MLFSDTFSTFKHLYTGLPCEVYLKAAQKVSFSSNTVQYQSSPPSDSNNKANTMIVMIIPYLKTFGKKDSHVIFTRCSDAYLPYSLKRHINV